MKKSITIALVLSMLALTVAPIYAQTVTAPTINVSLGVLDAFSLIVDVRRDNPPTFTDVPDTTMAFGNLIPNPGATPPNSTLVAAEGRVAFINVINNAGTQYTVGAVATALTRSGGSETIPNGAYVSNVNKTNPVDLGIVNDPPNTGVGTFTIFTSNTTGAQTQIEDHRTITDDPALGANAAVPLSQRTGTYIGTLVYSATRP